ncbi:hypothetical protein ACFSAG_14165 [Sphingorhabdus buctiana]|uniref:Uncharacterized protein n=1 Tax=Sphingorhabdus buctiana TaxID=1508805 RepID=A0ABW4MG72_9SPHN
MMLILQIAAGIVLGVAIIAYRHTLIYVAQALAVVAAVIAVVVALVALGSIGIEAGGPTLAKYGAKLAIAIGGMVLLTLIVIGAYGFAVFCGAVNFQPKFLERHIVLYLVANIAIVFAAFGVLSFVPPAAAFYELVNSWSRSNGYKDAGTSAIFGLAQQWPWLALGIMQLVKRGPVVADET